MGCDRQYLFSDLARTLTAASDLRPAELTPTFATVLCECLECDRTIPEIFQSKDKPLASNTASTPAKRSIRRRPRGLILYARMLLRPIPGRSATFPSAPPSSSS